MRKPITALAAVALLAFAYWSYDSLTRAPAVVPSDSAPPAARSDTSTLEPGPVALPEPTPGEAIPATPEPVLAVDDGDDHGEHGHAQETLPIVAPKMPPEQYANDPDPAVGERAALEEARSALEALLTDADPAVREEVTALLAVIAEAEAEQ